MIERSGVHVTDCDGEVWIQYSSLGKFGTASFPREGLRIENSGSVMLRRCTVSGTDENVLTALTGSPPRVRITMPGDELSLGLPLREAENREIVIFGSPGDSILLGFDLAPEFLYFPMIQSPLLLGPTFTSIPIGVVPASGFLSIPTVGPDLGPSGETRTFFLQPYALTPAALIYGGRGAAVTILDASF